MIEAIHQRRFQDESPEAQFAAFMALAEPRLRRGLAASVPVDQVHDAVAEALTWAWENWDRVTAMDNPVGYLYRVARSSVRTRRIGRVRYLLPEPSSMPDVEPGLLHAVRALPDRQRTVVWLVYACEWSYAEVAGALDISASAVGTHATRGLATLRKCLGGSDG